MILWTSRSADREWQKPRDCSSSVPPSAVGPRSGFLEEACAKAGLPRDAWRELPLGVLAFPAEVSPTPAFAWATPLD